jgi:hypothetical protein
MPTLFDELKALLRQLQTDKVEYALCGGLALAVHGLPRATVDIDLMIHSQDWDQLQKSAKKLGFTLPAAPMHFGGGKVEIRRVSKIQEKQVLTLDALLVTPALEEIWASRRQLPWENGKVWVISRDGLIALKKISGRPQDLADIQRLSEPSK